jgi:uncharacterized protein
MAMPLLTNPEIAVLGESPTADKFFSLGLMYSTGQSVPTNMVSAHKWFNIAAMNGSKQAAQLRHEIAAELSKAEIVAAQRAARDWVTRH